MLRGVAGAGAGRRWRGRGEVFRLLQVTLEEAETFRIPSTKAALLASQVRELNIAQRDKSKELIWG